MSGGGHTGIQGIFNQRTVARILTINSEHEPDMPEFYVISNNIKPVV
jgi:hypothetical protein